MTGGLTTSLNQIQRWIDYYVINEADDDRLYRIFIRPTLYHYMQMRTQYIRPLKELISNHMHFYTINLEYCDVTLYILLCI